MRSHDYSITTEEKLIEAVHGFPCLWQISSRAYKDLRAKENAWKEVALMVSVLAMCNKMPNKYKFLGRGWCLCRRRLKKVEKP